MSVIHYIWAHWNCFCTLSINVHVNFNTHFPGYTIDLMQKLVTFYMQYILYQ